MKLIKALTLTLALVFAFSTLTIAQDKKNRKA